MPKATNAQALADSVKIARMMIRRHGLQASAMAQERETIARLAPDPKGLDLWRYVQRAISELRATSPKTDAYTRPDHRAGG
jgi:hypothetical protein